MINILGQKGHWIRDEDIWVLDLALYDLGHTSLDLTLPPLCNENINNQMISKFFNLTLNISLLGLVETKH